MIKTVEPIDSCSSPSKDVIVKVIIQLKSRGFLMNSIQHDMLLLDYRSSDHEQQAWVIGYADREVV